MKCKGERELKEVPLINLLSRKDLDRLNKRFGRNWQPEKIKSTANIIEQVRQEDINKEIDRLMRAKPVKGGWSGI